MVRGKLMDSFNTDFRLIPRSANSPAQDLNSSEKNTMAKRKGAHPPKPKSQTNAEWDALIPGVRENFVQEITQMLTEVDPELWRDPGVCGLMYEFLPWQEHSSIAIQLHDDDETDPPSWANYECCLLYTSDAADE